MHAVLLVLVLPLAMDVEGLEAELHLETGMALLHQGLLDQAEEEFSSALELGEEYTDALLGLGLVNLGRESWTAASEYLRRFIEVCPADHRGYLEMAGLYLLTGKADSAAIMADSAFMRAPTKPSIWLLCGKVSLAVERLDEAEMWFSRGVDHGGETSMESLVLLASVYRRTQRGQEARDILMPAVDNGYAPASWELAKVYLGWDDYLRAGDAIRRYLLLSPRGVYSDSARLVLEELGESGEYME